MNFATIADPREIRHNLGLNQSEFWSRVGVTQSGGSRYESGRNMPKAVRELVRLVHVEQIDLAKVNNTDLAVMEYLKKSHADLYQSLKKAVQEEQSTASSVA